MPIMTMLETSRPVDGASALASARCRRGFRHARRRIVAEPVARQQHLADDLLRRQVAHQLLRAGMAEGAGERAADLAGEAERAAPLLRDVDRLHLDRAAGAARRKAQQPLARAVLGDLLGDDLRPARPHRPRRAPRAGPWRRWSSRRSRSPRARRASARAGRCASAPAPPARRWRQAPRRAPRGSCRPATAALQRGRRAAASAEAGAVTVMALSRLVRITPTAARRRPSSHRWRCGRPFPWSARPRRGR